MAATGIGILQLFTVFTFPTNKQLPPQADGKHP